MTPADRIAFEALFRQLLRMFHPRGDEAEHDQLCDDYFAVLGSYSLPQLTHASGLCLRDLKYFPKPAEWLARISPVDAEHSAIVPVLSAAESDAWHKASKAGFEGAPCFCRDCQAAGVTHRLIRFVPEIHPDGTDRRVRFMPGGQIETAGHWAHGDELKRWYAARDHFYDVCEAKLGWIPAVLRSPTRQPDPEGARARLTADTSPPPARPPKTEAPAWIGTAGHAVPRRPRS